MSVSIKGVIFDLDGTLVDSLQDIAEAININLAKRGHSKVSVKSVRTYLGHGLADLVKDLLPPGPYTPEYLDDLVKEIREYYLKNFDNHTTLYPGISKVLDELSRIGIKMVLLSNKHESGVKSIASKLLKKWTFRYVAGANDAFPLKPDPAIVMEICKHLKLLPNEILFIGDSETDIRTARNAGTLSVAVSWGYRDDLQLLSENPDFLIKNPGEIIKIINNLSSAE